MTQQIVALKDAQFDTSKLPILAFLNAGSSDNSINWPKLQEALRDLGYSEQTLPRDIKPRTALQRAVKDRRSKHLACDSLPGSVVGYQITDRTPSEDDTSIDYRPSFSLYFDEHGKLHSTAPADDLSVRIIEDFRRYLEESTLSELKNWLRQRILLQGGVKLADNGHVYFLPAQLRAGFERLTEALTKHTPLAIYFVPVGNSDQLADVIIGGLTNEVGQVVKTARARLDSDVGTRALKTQQVLLQQQLTRLERYEELLQVSMTELKQRAEDAKRTLTLTVVVKEAAEAEETQ